MMNKKKSRNKPSKNKTDFSPIISIDGKPYEVPVEGSLGLFRRQRYGMAFNNQVISCFYEIE